MSILDKQEMLLKFRHSLIHVHTNRFPILKYISAAGLTSLRVTTPTSFVQHLHVYAQSSHTSGRSLAKIIEITCDKK